MLPTFTPHRNLLTDLTDDLERLARDAKRRADTTDDEDLNGYLRGAQDAYTDAVGRLRNLLGAPLSTIVNVGEVFDAVEALVRAEPRPLLPGNAGRIAAEVIDARNVGGRA